MAETILLVDDDAKMQTIVAGVLEHEGFTMLTAMNGQDALRLFAQQNVDLTILDVKLPDLDGLDLLKKFVALKPHVPNVMISGYATIDRAVQATKLGAFDFLEKPLDPQRVLLTIKNGLEKGRLQKDQQVLVEEMMARYGIIGASEAIKKLYLTATRIAKLDIPVLIVGENGTGKELLASVVHRFSGRDPFVCVNCAAIPHELIESELFGHRKGSFTGAINEKSGKFQSANGGTLFLDEVGDMSQGMQAKVLRAIEVKEITKVGDTEPVNIDVRFIAATNKDLAEEIKQHRFREDLFYRLRGLALYVPPLREHIEDLQPLSDHFLREYYKGRLLQPKRLTDNALRLLKDQPWQGNIRELKHFIENLLIFSDGDQIDGTDVVRLLRSISNSPSIGPQLSSSASLVNSTRAFERDLITEALQETNGNITRAAEILHLDRATLSKKIKRLRIKR